MPPKTEPRAVQRVVEPEAMSPWASHRRTNSGACIGKDWTYAPIRLELLPDPAVFVFGRVRDDIKQITLRYANGDEQEIEPEHNGYVFTVVPPAHRSDAAWASSGAPRLR